MGNHIGDNFLVWLIWLRSSWPEGSMSIMNAAKKIQENPKSSLNPQSQAVLRRLRLAMARHFRATSQTFGRADDGPMGRVVKIEMEIERMVAAEFERLSISSRKPTS